MALQLQHDIYRAFQQLPQACDPCEALGKLTVAWYEGETARVALEIDEAGGDLSFGYQRFGEVCLHRPQSDVMLEAGL